MFPLLIFVSFAFTAHHFLGLDIQHVFDVREILASFDMRKAASPADKVVSALKAMKCDEP